MSAGLSSKQRTDRTYRFLKSIQRELSKANVATNYVKATRYGKATLVFSDARTVFSRGFSVSLNWGNMSNGGSVGTHCIYLVYEGETERYEGWGYKCAGTFDKGLEKIKKLFAVNKQEEDVQP